MSMDTSEIAAALPHHIETAVAGSLFGSHVPAAVWIRRLAQQRQSPANAALRPR